MSLRFLDLFAGAGGLSEGFIQAGYEPIAHVEMDSAAAYTLRTRAAFHHLKATDNLDPYINYLKGNISRKSLYSKIPGWIIDSVIHASIGNESLNSIFHRIDSLLSGRKLDLIIGGPPCQAYSIAGRSRLPESMKLDTRNYLFRYYAEFLKRYKPTYFVFENVTGLLTAKDEDGNLFLDQMLTAFRENNYETEKALIKAELFGVPQRRERIILVGKLTKKSFDYPMPETQPIKSSWSHLSDFPSLKAGEGNPLRCKLKNNPGEMDNLIRDNAIPVTHHWARPQRDDDLEIYRIAVEYWNSHHAHGDGRIHYNQLPSYLMFHANKTSFLDRFKVVAKMEPSHTVVAHIARDGHYYIHPEIDQNRSLTPREAARLQTFPDNFYFESLLNRPSRTPAFRQIGNAVPVLLARKIAEKLKEVW